MNNFNFYLGTDIIFGPGSVNQLPEQIDKLKAKTVLLVTDKCLVQSEIFIVIKNILDKASIKWSLYSEVEPDPTIELIDRGAAFYKEKQCELVIGFGGGSSIDTAKGIAVLQTNKGSIADYFGRGKIKKEIIPVIAIPTTAGTGSEVSMMVGVTDQVARTKNGIHSKTLLPRVAILDIQFLSTLPARIAAETAMDALSHLIESYVSKGANLMTDLFAIEGIRRCGKSLMPFVANRSNTVAAEDMSLAAMLGGIVISYARTGGAHTITRPISTGASHGLSTGLVLPFVMEYNYISNPFKFAEIARALGETTTGNLLTDSQKAASAVRQILKALGLPIRLRDIGIKEGEIPSLSKTAYKLDVARLNPRDLTEEAIESILHNAF